MMRCLKAPRETGTDAEEHDPKDHDMTEPQSPEDTPKEVISHKRIPAWVCELIQDAEKYRAPQMGLSKRVRDLVHTPIMWHYSQTS